MGMELTKDDAMLHNPMDNISCVASRGLPSAETKDRQSTNIAICAVLNGLVASRWVTCMRDKRMFSDMESDGIDLVRDKVGGLGLRRGKIGEKKVLAQAMSQ